MYGDVSRRQVTMMSLNHRENRFQLGKYERKANAISVRRCVTPMIMLVNKPQTLKAKVANLMAVCVNSEIEAYIESSNAGSVHSMPYSEH